MICPGMEDRLNDYADGSLGASERREVDRHLQSCAGCREGAEDLRALVSDLSALPRKIAPSRDLWPGTARVIQERKVSGGRRSGAFAWTPFWMTAPRLAAAASALIVTAAVLIGLGVRGPVGRPTPPAGPAAIAAASSAGAPADVAEAEAQFNRATVALLDAIRRRGGDLPPGTLDVIEENLRIVDRAIAETRAAQKRDPSNAELGRLVTASYQMKANLLREAAALPSGT
jgi:anti-sigma-K factor RskA